MQKSSAFLPALTLTYLLLPVFLFAWGWLRWPYALMTTLVAAGGMAVAIYETWKAWRSETDHLSLSQMMRRLWPALLIVTAWLSASGIGGFGQQTGDYESHNALLLGLITRSWPLRVEFEGQTANYVYYLGYYLPAGGLGKLFGWKAANIFIFFWSWAGMWLAFLWFQRISNVRNQRGTLAGLAVLFCLASGMDGIGYYLFSSHPFEWGKHIEHWAKWFQFSSQTSLLYWVPQQALAAWLIAGLAFESLAQPSTFRYLGMAVAACILWSPFGCLGIFPYLLVLAILWLWKKQWRLLLQPLSIAMNLGALWIGMVHSSYILSNQFDFPKGLLWNLVQDRMEYIKTVFVFWALEVGILAITAALLMLAIRRLQQGQNQQPPPATAEQWTFFLAACAVLAILPLFKMGYTNDLVMRSSIPSLFFLWAFTGRALFEAASRLGHRRVAILFSLLVLILAIGSYTSFSEIGRSVAGYHFGPPELAEVKTIEDASYSHIVAQRLGRGDTFFYRYLGR